MKDAQEHPADGQDKRRNPDPITGAPGSHPVGTGVGAAAGGAATGAAMGTVAGPAGTAAGAALGALVGGLAGKGIAETINPTEEDAYWQEHHGAQPYAAGRPYDDFKSAYQTGYEGYAAYAAAGVRFDDRERELRERYESRSPRLSWEQARPASRAAWERVDRPRPPSAVDGTPKGGPL